VYGRKTNNPLLLLDAPATDVAGTDAGWGVGGPAPPPTPSNISSQKITIETEREDSQTITVCNTNNCL
jgi:hypothetical protein